MKNVILFSFIILWSLDMYGQEIKHSIYFEVGNFNLNLEEKEQIKHHLNKAFVEKKILLIGYSDEAGEEKSNLLLSQKRAEAVRNILFTDYGVSLNIFQIIANGVDQNQKSKFLKRRVDVIFNNLNQQLSVNEDPKRVTASEINSSDQNLTLIEKINSIEKRVADLEQNQNTSELDKEIKIDKNNELDLNSDPKKLDKKAIHSEEKNSWFKNYLFELKLNYYSADQYADFNSSSYFDELLSDPMISVEIDMIKKINQKWSSVYQLGLRWNKYDEDIKLSTDDKWTGYAFRINSGLIYQHKEYLNQRIDFGFEQILSHTVDGLGIIDLELQPILEVNYQAYVRLINSKNYSFELGPKIGFIQGLDTIKQGYSMGLGAKTYIGSERKYFLYGHYENNFFKEDLRHIEVEILELGFGTNF